MIIDIYNSIFTTRWHGIAECRPLAEYVPEWMGQGAQWIGGCCRTGPAEIQAIRVAMEEFREIVDEERWNEAQLRHNTAVFQNYSKTTLYHSPLQQYITSMG